MRTLLSRFRWPLVWLAVTVAMLRPTPHRLSQTVVNDLGDPLFVTWVLSWGSHALWTDPLSVFDANIFYPNPNMLAFSDPMLSLAPVYGFLVTVSGGDRILALNLLTTGLFFLSLMVTHRLAKRLLNSTGAAAVSAVVFTANTFVVAQQNHPQLQTVGLISLAFLALFRAIEKPTALNGVALGAAACLLSLANLSYGVVWFVAAAIVLGVLGIRHRVPWRSLAPAALGAAVVTTAVLGPVALIYRNVGETHNLVRSFEPANAFLWSDIFTPGASNWLWGDTFDSISSVGRPGEHGAFPGVLALGLGLFGFALLLSRRTKIGGTRDAGSQEVTADDGRRIDEIWALCAAGLFAFVLSFGASPRVLGLLFENFHDHVPGFDGIRAPSRFVAIALLAGAVVVGVAAREIIERFPDRWQPLVPLVMVAIVVVELTGSVRRVDVPEGVHLAPYEFLADQEPGVVLELPIRHPGEGFAWPFVESLRMVHATIDFNPRVNGYSGHAPEGFGDMANVFNTVPDPAAWSAMEELGVDYVILHLGNEQGFEAYSEAEAAEILNSAPGTATRSGNDYVITLSE